MPKKAQSNVDPDTGLTADANDADDNRSVEAPDATAVREGELSAAQMEGGHGNVDPEYPDAQYPPGIVQTGADARAQLHGGIDPAETVPEKRNVGTPQTTDATPDYS